MTTVAKDGTTRDERGYWVEGTRSPNPAGRPPKAIEESIQRRVSRKMGEGDFLEAMITDAQSNCLKKGRGWRSDRAWLTSIGIPLAPRAIDLSVHSSDALSDLNDDQINSLLDGEPVVIEESSKDADTSGFIPASTSGA